METVYNIVYHKELDMICCLCGYMGLPHHCRRKVKGIINIVRYLDDCKLCKNAAERKMYNSLRWKKNEDGLAVCRTCNFKLCDRSVCKNCFCSSCYSSADENCGCPR